MRNFEKTPRFISPAFYARSEGEDLHEVAAILGDMRPEEDRISKFTWKTDKVWTKPLPKRWG
jgi:hypothetical protein